MLGSGSSGNAAVVSRGDTHVLVDVGLSGRETARRLRECGLCPGQISAIILSHEHGDHCRGVAAFCKDLDIPVFVSDGALEASGLTLRNGNRQRIEPGVSFEIQRIVFTPFSVPHDAADPIAFTIESDGVKVAIVVDLGYISNLTVERLKRCDAIVLESNHDLAMLKIGPYPWSLKQRVMSRRGHLSNESVAEYLLSGFDGAARHLVLAHLSKKNNLPDLALRAARNALEERSGVGCNQTRLALAGPDKIGPTIDL